MLKQIAFLVYLSTLALGQFPTPEERQRIQELTNADHRHLLEILHIQELRPGRNGSNPQAPNYANYDESKANPFPNLPDPLLLKNGKKVTSAKDWWSKRRPEIVEDFDCEIYGRVPKVPPKVRWKVTETVNEKNGDVPVITKRLLGHVDNSSYPQIKIDIQLNLSTPADAKGPMPIVMEFGFVFPPGGLRGFTPPAPAGPTWQQQVLAKGWGYAVIVPTSIQPDNGAGLRQGIIGLCNKGEPRKPDDWGAPRVGLGRQPRARLLRNRQSRRRQACRHRRPLALWQSDSRRHGL
jgi:hypothetical protein